MHNGDKDMQGIVSRIGGLLCVATYVLGGMAFNLFLNWYEMEEFSSSGSLPVAAGGIVMGSLALQIEKRLYHRYGFWPHNRLMFFLRLTVQSALYISLSFALGSAAAYIQLGVMNGGGFRAVLTGIALILPVGLFYSILAIPFGAIAGAVINLLLRRTRQ